MLTILIRTSYRPALFKRCLASIPAWCKIIVSYDDERALQYIGALPSVRVYKNTNVNFYDDYVNTLKGLVTAGYFMVVDDDDYIIRGALEKIPLTGAGVVCQFSRAGRLKPSDNAMQLRRIELNKIGMPCLILHHQHKNIAHLDGSKIGADYTWIKAVAAKVKLNFVPVPVVYADRRSRGAIDK